MSVCSEETYRLSLVLSCWLKRGYSCGGLSFVLAVAVFSSRVS